MCEHDFESTLKIAYEELEAQRALINALPKEDTKTKVNLVVSEIMKAIERAKD